MQRLPFAWEILAHARENPATANAGKCARVFCRQVSGPRSIEKEGKRFSFVIPAKAGIHLLCLCFYFLTGSRNDGCG